jgi:farnesyl diphosphate synthase
MKPEAAWPRWSAERVERIESVLEQALPRADEVPETLHTAMRYAALGAGKRVRALLTYAAGELVLADPAEVDAAAAAVELIHAYSLVHDDLPCMDDDVLRRGKPTCHVAFGEATALLAADALQTLAFELLTDGGAPESAARVKRLAFASGSRGMAGGQALDLASVGKPLSIPELQRMHRLKTGALIEAAVALGAGCGGALSAAEADALERYSRAIGLAFQVVDDVLDVEGTAGTLGKSIGKDAEQGKPTYVTLLGLTAAKEEAEALRTRAHDALVPFGDAALRLGQLADWVVLRSN